MENLLFLGVPILKHITVPLVPMDQQQYTTISNLMPYISNFWYISKFDISVVWDYKYLSCVYGVDRKICHEGHWSASRGLPSDAEQWSRVSDFLSTPYTHDRYFFLHTFWFTTFDFQNRTCYEITLFPLKGFYLSFKEVHVTSDHRSVLYVNV